METGSLDVCPFFFCKLRVNMADPIRKHIDAINEELDHPSNNNLWLALRRKGIQITRKRVNELNKETDEKQVLSAPQRAAGKSISEDDNRWMMDLIDFRVRGDLSYFLVCVNVFDRYMYARPLATKKVNEVLGQLSDVLDECEDSGRKEPTVISSDGGGEFRTTMTNWLKEEDIAHKTKESLDRNALGLVDRQIGILKQKLAQLAGRTKKSWKELLQQAVKAINATPKASVLHGEAPKGVKDNKQVRFMLMQDQADDLQHNKLIADAKKTQLESTGRFRPPIEMGNYTYGKRAHEATYGNPTGIRNISHGQVTATDGSVYGIKRVKIVPADASETAVWQNPNRKLEIGGAVMKAVAGALLEEFGYDVPVPLDQIEATVRAGIVGRHKAGQGFDALMSKIGWTLQELLKMSPRQFKLTQENGMWFVALKETKNTPWR